MLRRGESPFAIRKRKVSSHRKPWAPFLTKALLLSAAIVIAILWFEQNYVLGKDSQHVKCIPGIDWFLGDRDDRAIERDAIYMVRSKGLGPVYEDGTTLVKYLRGLPGDTVKIDATGVYINGVKAGTGQLPLAHKFNSVPDDFYGERVLGEDEYWFMGTAALSFDSRYWGSVSKGQVIRRAYPLF